MQCQHAVELFSVSGHLTRQHQLPKPQADVIKHEVFQHPILSDAPPLDPISGLDQPIPELKIYNNGFICAVDPGCSDVALSINSMKSHCSHKHPGSRKRNLLHSTKRSTNRAIPDGHTNHPQIRRRFSLRILLPLIVSMKARDYSMTPLNFTMLKRLLLHEITHWVVWISGTLGAKAGQYDGIGNKDGKSQAYVIRLWLHQSAAARVLWNLGQRQCRRWTLRRKILPIKFKE